MLRRGIVLAGLVALPLLGCGTRDLAPVGDARAASAAVLAPSATASVPAPAMPLGVTQPLHVTGLASGGRTLSCDARRPPSLWVDSGMAQGLPTTPRALATVSSVIVVATAVEARGYWQKDDGHLPAQNVGGMDLALLTATNFAIEREVKGHVGPWFQLIDAGADPATVTSCPALATAYRGLLLPKVGQRYVLFLQVDTSRQITRDMLNPLDFFPITNNMVHSPFGGADVPLDQFLATLQ